MVAPAAAIGFGKLIGLCVELAPTLAKIRNEVKGAEKAAQGKRQQVDGVGFAETSGAAQDSALAQKEAAEAAKTLDETVSRFDRIAQNAEGLPNNPTIDHATQALEGTKLNIDGLQKLPLDAKKALERARDALAVVLGPANPVVNLLAAAAQNVGVAYDNLVNASNVSRNVGTEVGSVKQ